MYTFLTVLALIGLIVFVIGVALWFAARDTATTTGGTVRSTNGARARTAIQLGVGGLTLWAVVTIILGIIALVDAWT